MYFIEHLCDMSQRENHLDFVRMMQRDILRVVDAVAPSDGSGAANVKVVRRVGLPPHFFSCAMYLHFRHYVYRFLPVSNKSLS